MKTMIFFIAIMIIVIRHIMGKGIERNKSAAVTALHSRTYNFPLRIRSCFFLKRNNATIYRVFAICPARPCFWDTVPS